MASNNTCRRATHAGHWYKGDAKVLNEELTEWLKKAELSNTPARAVIAPHAGYSYCGATSAFSFRQINPEKIKRVFILGPSHHHYISGCGITPADFYQTPFYNLTIDKDVFAELMTNKEFQSITLSVDEEEHSIEMMLPYIAKVMESKRDNYTIIPIMVGDIAGSKAKILGNIFSKYLSDPENLFVISSDFCHWGERFNYVYYDEKAGEIYKSIEALDRKGMEKIESLSPQAFEEYLSQYKNTICGRNPIKILLYAIQHIQMSSPDAKLSLKFLDYSQSSKSRSMSDSSVSYAAASLVCNN